MCLCVVCGVWCVCVCVVVVVGSQMRLAKELMQMHMYVRYVYRCSCFVFDIPVVCDLVVVVIGTLFVVETEERRRAGAG